ncbi:hypothetical protein Tco_0928492 [Tanacetum coccineum]
MAEFMANMNRGAGGDEAGGAGAGGAGAGGVGADGAGAGGAEVGGAEPAAPEITGCTYITFMKCDPQPFKGTEGPVRLCQWLEKLESVFQISDCKERDKEPIRVRALVVTVHNNLPEQIRNAQVEACKEENIGAEGFRGEGEPFKVRSVTIIWRIERSKHVGIS